MIVKCGGKGLFQFYLAIQVAVVTWRPEAGPIPLRICGARLQHTHTIYS